MVNALNKYLPIFDCSWALYLLNLRPTVLKNNNQTLKFNLFIRGVFVYSSLMAQYLTMLYFIKMMYNQYRLIASSHIGRQFIMSHAECRCHRSFAAFIKMTYNMSLFARMAKTVSLARLLLCRASTSDVVRNHHQPTSLPPGQVSPGTQYPLTNSRWVSYRASVEDGGAWTVV